MSTGSGSDEWEEVRKLNSPPRKFTDHSYHSSLNKTSPREN